MTTRLAVLVLAGCAFGCAADSVREMPAKVLRDKIAGGWAGQMVGVTFGAPTEFKTLGKINEGTLPKWTPDRVAGALEQDDLYVDMTFAKVLDDKGIGATSDDFGAMFREAKYPLWHANLAARRNLRRGIRGTDSGRPEYNAHANDIDFQIEADFIGLMAPGLFRSSNDIAYRAGRVMNYGEGIYGGMFVSCMYAAAFFENDPRKIVESGVACIPQQSPYASLIADVLRWSKQYPDDWKKVWHLIEDKWDRNDPCPDGALAPFNIDAKLNGAYVALGLLYGGKDFERTLDIATRSGQDSDCNPASAGGILGVILGYDAIPDRWKGGIPAIADKKFAYTEFSFRTIVDSTEKRALALIQSTGGGIEGDRVRVKVQRPVAAKLELWDYGTVRERIDAADPRWKWAGQWKPGEEWKGQRATSQGAEASIGFTGTGAIVRGPYLPDGGKADIFLDGKLSRTVDVCSDEEESKGGEDVWHAFGLKDGKHTVRVVVRGEPYAQNGGVVVEIQSLVVFR